MAGIKQIHAARVVVLRMDGAEAEEAAASLRSLGLSQVVGVTNITDLSMHISDNKVDVIVLADKHLPPGLAGAAEGVVRPPAEAVKAGIPCLLLLSSMSRAGARAATAAGFAAVMAADSGPRLIYRRVGALMQRVRRLGRARPSETNPA
jgi:hypothetical protein